MKIKKAWQSFILIAVSVVTFGCSTTISGKSSDAVLQKHLLAGQQYKSGKDELAIATWREVVASDPSYLEAWHNIAVVQEQRLQDRAAAEATLRSAVSKNPTNAPLRSALGGVLLNQGKIDESLAERQRARELAPTDPKIINSYASSCFSAQKFECALLGYNEVKKLEPDYRGIDFNRGLALLALGQANDAAAAFKAGTERAPLNSEAFGKLGDAYDASGERNKAIDAYEAALAIEPDLPWPSYNLGVLLQESNPNKSEQYYRTHLELQPNNGHAWSNLGLIFLDSGRTQEALRAQLRAVAAGPEIAHFHFNLGLTWYRNGCISKALESIAHALTIREDFPQALKLQEKIFKQNLKVEGLNQDSGLARLTAREANSPHCRD